MTETRNGCLKAVARDAAAVLGVVMALTAIGVSAQAEPVETPSADSQTAPPVEVSRMADATVTIQAPAASSTSTPSGSAPTNDPDYRPPAPRQAGTSRDREVRCLAEAIYYEARGESLRGQQAVAEVVANRVRSRAYPNSFCGVVYQRSRNVCQFSWACDSRRSAPRGAPWMRAMEIAERVHGGWEPGVVRGATHFHTTAVRPSWASRLPRVGQIGTHIFYRLR